MTEALTGIIIAAIGSLASVAGLFKKTKVNVSLELEVNRVSGWYQGSTPLVGDWTEHKLSIRSHLEEIGNGDNRDILHRAEDTLGRVTTLEAAVANLLRCYTPKSEFVEEKHLGILTWKKKIEKGVPEYTDTINFEWTESNFEESSCPILISICKSSANLRKTDSMLAEWIKELKSVKDVDSLDKVKIQNTAKTIGYHFGSASATLNDLAKKLTKIDKLILAQHGLIRKRQEE